MNSSPTLEEISRLPHTRVNNSSGSSSGIKNATSPSVHDPEHSSMNSHSFFDRSSGIIKTTRHEREDTTIIFPHVNLLGPEDSFQDNAPSASHRKTDSIRFEEQLNWQAGRDHNNTGKNISEGKNISSEQQTEESNQISSPECNLQERMSMTPFLSELEENSHDESYDDTAIVMGNCGGENLSDIESTIPIHFFHQDSSQLNATEEFPNQGPLPVGLIDDADLNACKCIIS